MTLSKSLITGHLNDATQIRFTLSAWDSELAEIVLPHPQTFDLVNGEIPATCLIWQNQAGLRGTSTIVTAITKGADGFATYDNLGSIQVGPDAEYRLADLLEASSAITPGNTFHVLTDAEYAGMTDGVFDAKLATAADRTATSADRVQTGIDAATATTQAGIATTQASIATTQADEATTSASTATTQADTATTKAAEAVVSAASADAARVLAETARDATTNLANAGMIPSAGGPVVAATTANITLSAPQTIDGVAVIAGNRVLVKNQTTTAQNGIYVCAAGAWFRATDMDTAAEVRYTSVYVISGTIASGKRFYTPSAVTTLGTDAIAFVEVEQSAWLVDFGTFPMRLSAASVEIAAMARVKRLQLYGANPSLFYSLKYLFWKDAGARFNVTIVSHTDADGTGAVEVATYSVASGADLWTGNREISLVQVSGSGVTGTLVIDLTDTTAMTVNTASSTSAMYQRRAIGSKAIVSSTARTTDVTAIVSSALALSTGLKKPFADAMTGTYPRQVIKDLRLYSNRLKSNQFFVQYINLSAGSGTPNVLIQIRDLTAGAAVCSYLKIAASPMSVAAFIATLPAWIRLDDLNVSPATGVYAYAKIDWASAVEGSNTYTTMVQSGIHEDNVLIRPALRNYLVEPRVDTEIRVGAAEAYTTLRAAAESLMVDPTAIPLLRLSNTAHFGNRHSIRLPAGAYQASDLSPVEFTQFEGAGPGLTIITPETTAAVALIEMTNNSKLRGMTIKSNTGDGGAWEGNYCVHIDRNNVNMVLSGVQLRNQYNQLSDMELIGGPLQKKWLTGCGISSGQTIDLVRVSGYHENPANLTATFGSHNTANSLETYYFNLTDCVSRDPLALNVVSLGAGVKGFCTIVGCDFNLVKQEITGVHSSTDRAVDRYEWIIRGNHGGAILQSDPDMLVLATTAGQTPSGTAAALIFGTTDELGRGDLWIKTGTAKSLGARLGDCSSVNKTLTIGGVTHTFTTNLTAVANSTIIAAINASIPLNPVSEANLQYEVFPDTGFSRRVLNSTGSTLTKGCFVRFNAAGTIVAAGVGERPDGWIFRDILNGSSGTVVTTKRIAQEYITGASASTGEWGLSAGGVIDYGAATKLGRTIGGIVTVWS